VRTPSRRCTRRWRRWSGGRLEETLASTAHATGDDEAALDHLDGAMETADRLGATPWLARSLVLRAEVLGASRAADEALTRAQELVDRHGLVIVGHQIERVRNSR
jgi:hypothetical protein